MSKNTIIITVIVLILLVGGVATYFIKSSTTVVNNTNQPTQTDTSSLETFTDANNTFTFQHNPLFPAVDGDSTTPTKDWELNAEETGVLLASVTVPRSYMSGTNFSEVRMTVGRSSDLKSCLIDSSGSNTKGTTVTLGGFPFLKFVFGDAAAGNLYNTTSYKGNVDGDCYVIEYTVHSTNIGNYSPDQGIKEFDKAKIETEMQKIIKSFRFLVNSD
jgi:hypothetical protein